MAWLTGSGAVDLQRLFDAAAARQSGAARKSERVGRARSHVEGRLFCFPVVLGRETDGPYLRPFVAGALGRAGRSEAGEGLLKLFHS